MKVTIEINRPGWSTSARLRRLRPLLLVLALVFAGPVLASDRFSDVPNSNDHHDNISAIADAGITLGCNAEGTMYCPDTVVTRDQMASFIARTAGLGDNPPVANAATVDGKSASDLVRAAQMSTGARTAIGVFPSDVTYGTALSITAPSAGFVVVNASVTIQNDGCTSLCLVSGRVRHITSGNTSNWTEEDLIGEVRAAISTSTVFSVAAGVNTFDIRLSRPLVGNGTLNGSYAEMNAIFVPFGSTGGSMLGASVSEPATISEPELKER